MTRTLSATLTALVLLAACGGERGTDTAARPGDTAVTGAAPAPADSAAGADSMGQAVAPAAAGDTTAAAPAPAAPPRAAPSDTGAKLDTSSRTQAKKPARKTQAEMARVQQDTTTSAASPAGPDTSKPTAAAPSPDTGSAGSQQAEAPLRDAYHQPPKDTVSQATYDGWKQFNLNCARCHGEDVTGTTIAPHLVTSLKPDGPISTKELFVQTVCAGRPAKGMPSWCALGMDMGKINDIYAYVKGRSDGKIHPGRPAVKPEG